MLYGTQTLIQKMDINFIQLYFIFNSVGAGGLGLLINYFEPYLPVFITRLYRYGKHMDTRHHFLLTKCEVPKRWYRHFYMFAAPASSVSLLMVLFKHFYENDRFKNLYFILDVLLGKSRRPTIPPEIAVICIFLITVQCWKRLYETLYVNIFSDKKMNIIHYLLGLGHYAGALIAIIGESQHFFPGTHSKFNWHRVNYLHFLGIMIFLWLSYKQFCACKILRRLRTDSSGSVTSDKYKIPRGDLFEYISSPLQFTEIVMYIILSLILWKSSTFHYVTLWVLLNQVECAVLSHQWYQKVFNNYPQKRKILIPYIF